ncbi:MAG: c-type cytochrome [Acidobacteriota bacterium]
MSKRMATLILGGCLAGLLGGCTSEKPPLQFIPNMDNQPKFLPQAASTFFASGGVMQAPPEGTIARGDLREDEEFFTGRSFWSGYVRANPMGNGQQVIARGRERFGIYCTPCHGVRADGQGMLFTRAKIKTANLLEERVREQPDGKIFEVITSGLGMMPAYNYPIPPRDRWAIVAYLRTLQAQASPASGP